MRADRLVALLLLFQRRTRLTAAEVATELEVSLRTARRDLEALAIAGIPIYPERGRGGGWRLLGGARTDLSGLKADEVRALFQVAGPATAATPELKAALRKLVQALPEPFRGSAEASATSVVVDPAGWGRRRRPFHPVHLDALQAAVVDRQQVRLGYRDRAGKASARAVHPLGLAVKGTVWYLVAGTNEGMRTFRVSRVTSVERTGEPALRPNEFDLDETWREVVDRVDELRSPVAVVANADPEIVDVLTWMFERQLDVGSKRSNGRVQVTVRGSNIEIVAAQLAGFGRRIEVISPVAARRYLACLGQELNSVYGLVAGVQPSRR
jgi:predicted DNA-binding transcriptional regulator YafY